MLLTGYSHKSCATQGWNCQNNYSFKLAKGLEMKKETIKSPYKYSAIIYFCHSAAGPFTSG
ncbi:hypothetical protein C1N53_16695 [Pontibacter sp. SGAir0037]|nr:hypothetical protein C1N53_16695 [Pontibacter sp. SGAir0037]